MKQHGTSGERLFKMKTRGAWPLGIWSFSWLRGCKLSRESGEERFKSDLHDIWPAHSLGTLFRDAILSWRFRDCIKIATTANWIPQLVAERGDKKAIHRNTIRCYGTLLGIG